jgi:hypothetical protein
MTAENLIATRAYSPDDIARALHLDRAAAAA